METALRTAEMMAWIRKEQVSLWQELAESIRRANNGHWSMDSSNIARRIVEAARLVGAVENGGIPYSLTAGGVYEAVLEAGGVSFRPPTEQEWERYDAMMSKYGTTREICQPEFAATVAAIKTPGETRWIAGVDE